MIPLLKIKSLENHFRYYLHPDRTYRPKPGDIELAVFSIWAGLGN